MKLMRAETFYYHVSPVQHTRFLEECVSAPPSGDFLKRLVRGRLPNNKHAFVVSEFPAGLILAPKRPEASIHMIYDLFPDCSVSFYTPPQVTLFKSNSLMEYPLFEGLSFYEVSAACMRINDVNVYLLMGGPGYSSPRLIGLDKDSYNSLVKCSAKLLGLKLGD